MIAACTQAAPPPEPGSSAEAEELAAEAPEITTRVIEATPEMAAAALTGDPVAMQQAATSLLSCPGPNQCPAQYGSCSGWSQPEVCGSVCTNIACICKPWMEPCGDELRARDVSIQYQVCSDIHGATCVNIQQTQGPTYCGC